MILNDGKTKEEICTLNYAERINANCFGVVRMYGTCRVLPFAMLRNDTTRFQL